MVVNTFEYWCTYLELIASIRRSAEPVPHEKSPSCSAGDPLIVSLLDKVSSIKENQESHLGLGVNFDKDAPAECRLSFYKSRCEVYPNQPNLITLQGFKVSCSYLPSIINAWYTFENY